MDYSGFYLGAINTTYLVSVMFVLTTTWRLRKALQLGDPGFKSPDLRVNKLEQFRLYLSVSTWIGVLLLAGMLLNYLSVKTAIPGM